ncbi:MAG TPA: GreA/GreB family elongation factor [Gammaproteobacteria bacterium]|nr:GreA/GreB family elongation factor [Gammaproteobacteria bacterium]
MSRAFVKEPDGDAAGDELPERAPSPHPNYMTPGGARRLAEKVQNLRDRRDQLVKTKDADMTAANELKQLERELRYLEHALQSAIVIDTHLQAHDDVRFGAAVTVIDEENRSHTFTIVGEEETCAPRGCISWVSPLARSLLGRKAGDVVLWERPLGNVELEITAIHYPDLSQTPAHE